MELDVILPCFARRGHFSDEFGVVISSTEEERHSFITDRSFVAASDEPEDGEEVEGEIYGQYLKPLTSGCWTPAPRERDYLLICSRRFRNPPGCVTGRVGAAAGCRFLAVSTALRCRCDG